MYIYDAEYIHDGETLLNCPKEFSGVLNVAEGVITINYGAFDDCKNITKINIPKSVKYIHAFENRHNAETSIILRGILGSYVVAPTKLSAINVDPENPYFSSVDGVLYNKDKTILLKCPNVEIVNLPETVEEIHKDAFEYCVDLVEINVDPNNKKYLSINGVLFNTQPSEIVLVPNKQTTLTFPDNFNKITMDTLKDLEQIKTINISRNVIRIELGAFTECKELCAINVDPKNVKYSSDKGILYNYHKTTLIRCPLQKEGDIIIPDSVVEIAEGAFEYCNKITSVHIPDGITYIEAGTFFNCHELTNVNIPNTVKKIGAEAFTECPKLNNIYIPKSVEDIDYLAFDVIENIIVDPNNKFFYNCEL